MISIIIPVRNEEKYILDCLKSILSFELPSPDEIEIIIVDGQSDDKTREIINQLIKKNSQIILLENNKQTVPYAMNLGINKASGSTIIRLDAHAEYPKDYILKLLYWQKKLRADNIGGVIETLPADNTTKAKAIALALSSSFGVGNSHFRIGIDKPLEVDTVPFGCFKKDVFKKIGLYDEELIRNQDDELNARLKESGGSIWLIPEIKIKYYPRATFRTIFKMFFQYGYFKPLVNLKLKKPSTLRQFAPPIFVIYLMLGLLLPFLPASTAILYFVGLGVYFILNLYFSFLSTRESSSQIILWGYISVIYFVVHLAYGLGYLKGFLKFFIIRKLGN